VSRSVGQAEVAPHTTSYILELHTYTFMRRRLQYHQELASQSAPIAVAQPRQAPITQFFGTVPPQATQRVGLVPFSTMDDPEGYGGNSITDDLIADVYTYFLQSSRRAESEALIRGITGSFMALPQYCVLT
jgi:hypothetical protein